ncbi:glutamate receptor ionotropic, delta-2-like [Centruroides vittatus]|uniref:glutamate receptor ionotropic, delta-2-like n=1 Tax=Centruroides vittatus TaxID=120091 RepID=UPI00351010A6
MSYSSSIIDTSTTFTISAAKPLSKAVSLIKPFDKMVWIFISFSFVILLSTLYIVIKKETEYCNNGKLEFSTLFWILLRNFLRQDARINRCFYNTFRILIGCWILIAFVLTSAYVGILPSYIVNPGTESIPQTFEELTQSVIDGRYNITFYVLSDECRYFDRCPFKKFIPTTIIRNDVIEIFYENVIKYDETCTEQVEKVVKGTYALLASKHNIELSISKSGKEKFFVSKDALFTKFSFIQMNLARVNYAVEIAKTVNLIQQSGLPEKIRENLLHEATRKDLFYKYEPIDTNKQEVLEMDDIMGPLYLLGAGYLIAFVVFVTEILVNKIKIITRKKSRVRPFKNF